MRFRVQLSDFAGPLDLLLHLVRRSELDPLDIPIAEVADQYLEMVETLEQIDADAVGDFLDLATRLMEAKARMMLPRQEPDSEEAVEDPHEELVRRLLEYKDYRDAAGVLQDQGREWQKRLARRVDDLPETVTEQERPLGRVEVWDLVSAFSAVMRRSAATKQPQIQYDDTPIEVYMQQIRDRLREQPRVEFAGLFSQADHRSRLIGIFLALLELVRHHEIRAEQEELFGRIWVSALPQATPAGAA